MRDMRWRCKCGKITANQNCPSVIGADLDRSEVLVKFRVQRGQLVDGAVESAVVVTQDLTQEEGGKRDVHNNALCIQTL